MWTRSILKQRAKTILNHSYWKSVLAALILTLSTGGMSRITAVFRGGSDTGAVQHYNFNINGVERHIDMYRGVLPHFHISGVQIPQAFSGAAPLLLSILGIAAFTASIAGIALAIFVFGPLEIGAQRYFIVNRVMTGQTSAEEMIYPFGHSYINVVKGMFLRNLYIFLWSLLMFFPGVIKAYSYRLVPYILAESPDMETDEAFRLSREMMDGSKFDAFILDLSFIGWEILSACTMGVLGAFYVKPYRACTNAELYATLRDRFLGHTA